MSTTTFNLPDLGDGIDQAEVIEWKVQPGESVSEHQVLLEVQTDKAMVELPSPVTGVLLEHGAAEGATLQTNDVVATFEVEGGAAEPAATPAPDATPAPAAAESAPAPAAAALAEQAGAADTASRRRPLAAPTVRKLARELDIDLTQVTGTGPSGRVLREDVEGHVAGGASSATGAQQAEPADTADTADTEVAATVKTSPTAADSADSTRIPLRGLRRAISRKMTETLRTVPHVTGLLEVDVTEAKKLLAELRPIAEAEGVRLTWGTLFAAATVQSIRKFPQLNAYLDVENDEIVQHHRIHLGVATATDDGLLVPVVRDADRLSLLELAAEINRVTGAARERKATQAELTGSTFTVTNYGAVGGWFGTPMVNLPEIGIVGFGRIEDRPAVRDGEIVVRTMTALSHTVDHRLIDGAINAGFGDDLRRRLEEPKRLILGGRPW